ncbi:hypothetical protein HMPREF9141_1279 [Prevotella multiformis DSM 16608]|uniref:Uncharacterized protein n=1 Tax=Prevotella multiformis DSM 16608 TaxID=888743 RepID=F0F6Q7_9BACT|nr:hypothetical protein HMPREF9141_1279 [Prevotella multiformis DSM 16608]
MTDTTAYTRHQAEVRRLCKTYPKKRRRYFTSGRTDGNGDLPPVPLNMKLG